MSQTNEVDTLEQEELQNTDTELGGNNNDTEPDNSIDTDVTPDNDTQPEESLKDDDKLTKEQLDAMSDEEFTRFMEEGKLPEPTKSEQKPLVKVISKPEPKAKATKADKEPTKLEDEEVKETSSKDVDYEAVYKDIFKPFRANGKEITPRNVEDVIQLMQMGANYTKKMQLMAPLKKAAESLSRAGIKEDDLNFLIDVHKGDKEAIKKLLTKHNVDPMELDLDTTNYVPKNNIVSDEDVEYSNILDDIRDSLPKIQEIMTNIWDAKSKEALLKDPNLMRALHEEIAMGRFDNVQAQLEIEKTFGRYKGKSDVEAYIDLVTKLAAKEQSNHQPNSTNKPTPKADVPTKPIPDKTKAAPIRTKATNQGSTLTAKDIFSMSEEQFAKLSIRDLV
jgi:hypothetical protein